MMGSLGEYSKQAKCVLHESLMLYKKNNEFLFTQTSLDKCTIYCPNLLFEHQSYKSKIKLIMLIYYEQLEKKSSVAKNSITPI